MIEIIIFSYSFLKKMVRPLIHLFWSYSNVCHEFQVFNTYSHTVCTHLCTVHTHLYGAHTYSHTVYTHDALLLLEYKESIACR